MAFTAELQLENAIGHIAKGVGAELEERVKAALMPYAEKVVEDVAKQLCANLKTNMVGYIGCKDKDVNIALIIDGTQYDV